LLGRQERLDQVPLGVTQKRFTTHPSSLAESTPDLSETRLVDVQPLTGPPPPKTRSGKIKRRLLGEMLESRPLGDTTWLQDETVLRAIERVVRG